MLITAAEERKKGMTALFLDGEYAVSVDSLTLAASGFHVGGEISDEELYELLSASKISRAKEKALYLIEYCPRTCKELTDRLVPLYGEEAAEAAVSRMEELGLIDDEAYAREYALQLIERKHFSAERVRFELIRKGIDRSLAEEILEELEPDACEQIRILLATKYARRLSDEKERSRTANSLRRMGFRWSDIQEAMRETEG